MSSFAEGSPVRWTSSEAQPVRVFIDTASGEQILGWQPQWNELVWQAFTTWQEASKTTNNPLYLRQVGQAAEADLLVRWSDVIREPHHQGEVVYRYFGNALITQDLTLSPHPVSKNSSDWMEADDFYAMALHEVGHVLGLVDSSDPSSVMGTPQGKRQLTLPDKAQMKQLYADSLAVTNRVTLNRLERISFYPLLEQAQRAVQTKQLAKAAALFKQAEQQYENEPFLQYWLAQMLLNEKHLVDAKMHSDKALALNASDPDVLFQAGRIHYQLGKLTIAANPQADAKPYFEMAKAYFEKILPEASPYATAQDNLALCMDVLNAPKTTEFTVANTSPFQNKQPYSKTVLKQNDRPVLVQQVQSQQVQPQKVQNSARSVTP